MLDSFAITLPGEHADKEERGRVLIVGGSNEVPGAVLLAGMAALRVGAGKLRLATTRSAAVPLAVAVPEARVFALDETAAGALASTAADAVADAAAAVDAVVLGPGIIDVDAAGPLIEAIASAERPKVVLDAGALLCLAERARRDVCTPLAGRLVLTPNRSELASIGERDVAALAHDLGAVVSLKGSTTRTFTPDGCVYADSSGNPGLATSGSGDVVAGAAGGFLARGASPLAAAVWANHVHGIAGERLAERVGPIGFIARELADELPRVLAALAAV
ncbi:MAG TPA: NAD(P)H-hydrate dehydratase [Acidimicrobiales bacterium]|nr:NAD(P)H-hydrate dehydratase [Acidimicrobiales bacterium]